MMLLKLRFAEPMAANVLELLSEKFPRRLNVPVPPDKLAILKVVKAVGFIVKFPLTVMVAEPEVAKVLVEATLLLIVKLPDTVVALLVPVVENTNLPDPLTMISPPTLNELFENVSNNLSVREDPPLAVTVRLPFTVVSAPARLILVPVFPLGQFHVK